MRKSAACLVVSLACASSLALAFPGSAAAGYAPRLVVATATDAGGGSTTVITVAQAPADDPTAEIYIDAALRFVTPLRRPILSEPAGAKVGTATARVQAADLGGAVLALRGAVTVANGAQAAEFSRDCFGTAFGHPAVWSLNLAAPGVLLPIRIPMFVNFGGRMPSLNPRPGIRICLPPGDVPPGTPGRVPLGIKLVEATVTVRNIFAVPAAPAEHRWGALFTPYTPGTGRPNARAAVQTQAVMRSPARLSLAGRLVEGTRRTARLSGRLRAGGEPVPGVRVQLLARGRVLAVVRTDAGGEFTRIFQLRRPTTFRARVTVSPGDAEGGCVPPLPVAPGVFMRCAAVTTAGFTAESNEVTVASRRAARRRALTKPRRARAAAEITGRRFRSYAEFG